MSNTKTLSFALVLLMASALLTGCFSTAQYHTAETLKENETSLGFGWGVTKLESVSATNADGKKEEADLSDVPSIPNIIPDVVLRFGLQDDLELGAKLFLVGGQADLKWRFYQNGGLSLALDPTVGYARPFLVLEELSFALPLMATFRISKRFAVYASAKFFISDWSFPADGDGADEANSVLNDLLLGGFGGTVGVSIDFKNFWIRPEVNFVNFLIGPEDTLEEISFVYTSFGLAFGFNFGTDEERIKSLEDRMDKMENH